MQKKSNDLIKTLLGFFIRFKPGWWFIFGVTIMAVSLGFSMRTYRMSLERKEPVIAQLDMGGLNLEAIMKMMENLLGIEVNNMMELMSQLLSMGFSTDKIAEINFTQSGEVRIYYWPLQTPMTVGIGFVYGREVQAYEIGSDELIDTGVEVTKNGQVIAAIVEYDPQFGAMFAEGFKGPIGNHCGDIDVAEKIAYAQAQGEKIESVQCWGDYEADGGKDYDDFLVIWSYKSEVWPSPSLSPLPSPSSSPSPSPSPSPLPSPSPSPDITWESPQPSFPPYQPDTGTRTWLVTGSLILGAGLVILKLVLGI